MRVIVSGVMRRMMVEYDNYRMSLKRLEEQYENYIELDEALPR